VAKPKESLVSRAIIAVLLYCGFYILSLLIAGILFFIPYAEWAYAGRLHFRLAFFCIIGAGAILWAIIPRIDRFIPPGPRLYPEKDPQLFREIANAAQKLNQKMPVEVYFIPDVNAWVAERGGLMGFGSRRVMGLGAPLLQILSVTELQGVLAHEFGHYYGGDTKLGPWIYKTRSTIERTLQGLAGHSTFIQKPFIAYGNLFLRVTHAISRRQEFKADELAAGYTGRNSMISALQKIFTAAEAYQSYWNDELAPALNAGFLPPYAGGFHIFLEAGSVKEAMTNLLTKELESGVTDPYATHPALKDRLKALEALSENDAPDNSPSAVSLLGNLRELELELFSHHLGASLQPTSWENVAHDVYRPRWAEIAQKQQSNLSGLTLKTLPERLADFDEFSGNIVRTSGEPLWEKRKSYAALVVAAAATTKLIEAGWEVKTDPGMDIVAHFGTKSWEPFTVVRKLFFGDMTPEEWQVTCNQLEISDLALT